MLGILNGESMTCNHYGKKVLLLTIFIAAILSCEGKYANVNEDMGEIEEDLTNKYELFQSNLLSRFYEKNKAICFLSDVIAFTAEKKEVKIEAFESGQIISFTQWENIENDIIKILLTIKYHDDIVTCEVDHFCLRIFPDGDIWALEEAQVFGDDELGREYTFNNHIVQIEQAGTIRYLQESEGRDDYGFYHNMELFAIERTESFVILKEAWSIGQYLTDNVSISKRLVIFSLKDSCVAIDYKIEESCYERDISTPRIDITQEDNDVLMLRMDKQIREYSESPEEDLEKDILFSLYVFIQNGKEIAKYIFPMVIKVSEETKVYLDYRNQEMFDEFEVGSANAIELQHYEYEYWYRIRQNKITGWVKASEVIVESGILYEDIDEYN